MSQGFCNVNPCGMIGMVIHFGFGYPRIQSSLQPRCLSSISMYESSNVSEAKYEMGIPHGCTLIFRTTRNPVRQDNTRDVRRTHALISVGIAPEQKASRYRQVNNKPQKVNKNPPSRCYRHRRQNVHGPVSLLYTYAHDPSLHAHSHKIQKKKNDLCIRIRNHTEIE